MKRSMMLSYSNVDGGIGVMFLRPTGTRFYFNVSAASQSRLLHLVNQLLRRSQACIYVTKSGFGLYLPREDRSF